MIEDRLSEFSRALFKNAHLLPASMQIVRFSDGHFTRRQLAKALDVNDNVVDTVLVRLKDAGLVKEGARTRGSGGGVDLARQSSPFWVFVEQVCDALLGPGWRTANHLVRQRYEPRGVAEAPGDLIQTRARSRRSES